MVNKWYRPAWRRTHLGASPSPVRGEGLEGPLAQLLTWDGDSPKARVTVVP
jgi:hypothetical protein